MPLLFGHTLTPLLILFAGSLFLTVGDIVAKQWVKAEQPVYFIATLMLYLIGLVCLIMSFRFKNIAVASLILILLNVITLALWSWLMDGEALNRVELMGLVLGLAAVVLLEYSHNA
jgi:multidrug transporter EmrE-like cation transporter